MAETTVSVFAATAWASNPAFVTESSAVVKLTLAASTFYMLRSACTARWTRSSVEYLRRCGGKDGAVNYEDRDDVQEAARESRRSRSLAF